MEENEREKDKLFWNKIKDSTEHELTGTEDMMKFQKAILEMVGIQLKKLEGE
jgi:hypothetical protein